MVANKRRGFSLVEIIIVITIIAVLTAASVLIGSKQVSKSRIQEAATFAQTMDSSLEEGITDIGFLNTLTFNESDAADPNLSKIKGYVAQLEDSYLNCFFDYSTLSNVSASGYEGFKISVKSPIDPWGNNYVMYYMYSSTSDRYRITIASNGPNSIAAPGAGNGYVNISSNAADLDDDVVDILISR